MTLSHETITHELLRALPLAGEGRVFDLSHDMTVGMPVLGFHIPYSLLLHSRHGDAERPSDTSYANEVMIMSAHTATHIDALGHISRNGKMFGERDAASHQTPNGLTELDASKIPPILRRGVLLDIARHRGVDCLPAGSPIHADELSAAAGSLDIGPGDVVLIRTGWSQNWGDPETFNGNAGGYPGVSPDGARWLIDRGVFMAGSDTPALEVAPTLGESVHGLLLVDNGIFIAENFQLESLAQAGHREFLFIMLAIKIVGATGSPARPVAIV